jgi:hypothetical protein
MLAYFDRKSRRNFSKHISVVAFVTTEENCFETASFVG